MEPAGVVVGLVDLDGGRCTWCAVAGDKGAVPVVAVGRWLYSHDHSKIGVTVASVTRSGDAAI